MPSLVERLKTSKPEKRSEPDPEPSSEPTPEPPPEDFVEAEFTPKEALQTSLVTTPAPVTDIIETEKEPALAPHHVGIERAPQFTTEALAQYAYEEILRSGFSDVGSCAPEVENQLARGLKQSLILDIGGKVVFLEANERGELGYHYPFKSKVEVTFKKFKKDTYDRLPAELKDESDLKGSPGTALAQFTQVVTGTIYDMTSSQTFYNRLTRQYIQAPCLPRRLTARYDENIAQWLRALGGDKHEKLLDWIATYTDLTKPTCAVYIHGKTRAGKTLLATGLSRYWTKHKKATPLWRYFDTFNNDVIRSGILLADEEMTPERVKFKTTDLRDLIMSETHDIFTKNQDSARALGCFRVMLASNASSMLDLDIRGLDPNSLEAVGLRFLPIEATKESSDFIRSIGGREGGTKHWIDGDLIARHALWLRDNRVVTPGQNGLLVEGDMAASRDLLVATGPADTVLGLLTDILSGNTVPGGLEADTVFWGTNKIYIVMDKLRIYLDGVMKRPYQRKTLSNSLTNLQVSNAPEQNRPSVWPNKNGAAQIRPRVFEIDPQHLMNYMKQTQSGDSVKVSAALQRAVCKGNGLFAPLGDQKEDKGN